MRKVCASLLLCGSILTASAAATGPVRVNGVDVTAQAMPQVHANTTYVSLRGVTQALRPQADISWAGGQARVEADGLSLTARPGADYITANGAHLDVPLGVKAAGGRVLVPVRVLAQAMGAQVHWDPKTGVVTVRGGDSGGPEAGSQADDLYWLSRIVSAESRGEPLEGQIAVANVVLNRVESEGFPDSIYGVIFDERWGGQFTPVRNGTIYQTPAEQSVRAAQMALEGANTAQDSLYFLAPALASNFWVMENRTFVKTIGNHWFYK